MDILKAVKTVRYIVFQHERGEKTGHVHYQGYIEFSGNKRLSGMKKIHKGVHWEGRRGTQEEARAYATKDDTRIAGPWEWGKFKGDQGARSDRAALFELAKQGKTVKEAAEAMPGTWMSMDRAYDRARSMYPPKHKGKNAVYVILGPTGLGKTHMAETLGSLSFWEMPIKGSTATWFDGYDGQQNVLIDEYTGQIPLEQFLRLLRPRTVDAPNKGGHIWWYPIRIFISSNLAPHEWYDFKGDTRQWEALLDRFSKIMTFSLKITPTGGKVECVQDEPREYYGLPPKPQIEYLDFVPIPLDYEDDLS